MSAHPTRKTSNYLAAAERLPEGGMIIVPDVTWDEYEQLLAELGDRNRFRVSYDHLTEQGYVEAPASRVFPFLTGDVLTRFLERSKTEKQRIVLKSFRQWVRMHRPKMR